MPIERGKRNHKKHNSNNNILIYEREYVNGELSGKVRDFNDKGQLVFEGEYLDGIINGEVKGYDYGGKIKFEGEYLYDHKLKGKEYVYGRLEYEGEFLFDRKWNGKGFDENGNIIYELINGNGKVKEYGLNDKLIFEAEYLNGKKMEKEKNIMILAL